MPNVLYTTTRVPIKEIPECDNIIFYDIASRDYKMIDLNRYLIT